jgi:preprotein translocase subunit SecE
MKAIKKAVSYFREVFDEMRKITWPSREATIRYSIYVVIVSVAVGAFFAALDFVFNFGLEQLLNV